MQTIHDRIETLRNQVLSEQDPQNPVQIMAVTKYATLPQIQAIISGGITLLGENKIQDALAKQNVLKDPSIHWHFIGHLQRNKLQKALHNFEMIQSIDRLSLIEDLSSAAVLHQKKTPILLEVNTAQDPNKFGFSLLEIQNHHPYLFSLPGIQICGLMTIPPLTITPEDARPYFAQTKSLYDHLKSLYSSVSILSMGMSSDYRIAIQEGSTMIRVGRYLTS